MEQGRFAYKANLEQARKALLDSSDTDFSVSNAEETVQKVAQGLMRPRKTEAGTETGGGFGMGLMQAIQQNKAEKKKERVVTEEHYPLYTSTDGNKTSKVRPHSRAQGSANVSETQMLLYQGMLDRGMEPHIAQAFMSNFKDESAFNVDITEGKANVHGTFGKGIYQLTGSRRDAYEAKYGNSYTVDNQLDWLMYELEGSEKSAWNKIKNTKSAGEAGAAIVTNFLRPAEKHRKHRAASYRNGSGLWSM